MRSRRMKTCNPTGVRVNLMTWMRKRSSRCVRTHPHGLPPIWPVIHELTYCNRKRSVALKSMLSPPSMVGVILLNIHIHLRGWLRDKVKNTEQPKINSPPLGLPRHNEPHRSSGNVRT